MIKLILDRMFGYSDVYESHSTFFPKSIEDVIIENTYAELPNGL